MEAHIVDVAVAVGAAAAVIACVSAFHARRLRDLRRGHERFRSEVLRADADLRRLIVHRLANPLAVIGGAAHTLHADNIAADRDLATGLLDAILREVERLEETVLDPLNGLRPEEEELRPLPLEPGGATRATGGAPVGPAAMGDGKAAGELRLRAASPS